MKFFYCTSIFMMIFSSIACQNSANELDPTLKSATEKLDSIFVHTPILKEDIHSLLVYQEDQEMIAHYYNQYGPDSLNHIKSITKSIVGLLVGIAIDQGIIESVNQKVLPFFDDCGLSDPSGKDKITIEHLLLMQSGIAWNNRARIKDQWWFNESPHCYLLTNFPMDTLPGRRFSYNSGVAHLLSGIISRASGMSTKAFADQYLFGPLGIKHYDWEQDRAGEYRGHSELSLLPKDMLKIGRLILQKGTWDGQQIVSNSWLDQTFEKAYDASRMMDYGYLWMTSKEDEPYFVFGGGSGGQHIFIMPEKSMVVVTTGHWDNARSTREIMEWCKKILLTD